MHIGPAFEELLRVLQDPQAVAAMMDAAPFPARCFAGAIGALILVAGAKLYRLAVIAPGFVLGIVAGRTLLIVDDPMVISVATVGAGVLGALVFHFLERLAIALIGALIGAQVTAVLWPLVVGVPPWWGVVVGSVVGSLFFTKLFRNLLMPLTAILGAFMLASCFAEGQNLLAIGLLAVVGATFQSAVL